MEQQESGFLSGPEVWSGASLRGSEQWVSHLNSAEIDEIDAAVKHVKTMDVELTSLTRDDFPMPLMTRRFEAVRNELEGGRGFALLRGLPIERYSQEDSRILFWGLSVHLGEPQEQDRAGNRLHSVTNTGLRVEKNNSVRSYTVRTLSFICVSLLGAAPAFAQVHVEVMAPPPPRVVVSARPPPRGGGAPLSRCGVQPGVQVVQDSDEEVFFSGGWYWRPAVDGS